EDVRPAPELQDLLLQGREVGLRLYRPVGRHVITSPAGGRPRPPRTQNASSLPGTRREAPAVPPCLAGPSRDLPPLPAPTRASRCHGRTRPRLLGLREGRSGGGSGRMFTRFGRRARTVPGSLHVECLATRSRRRLCCLDCTGSPGPTGPVRLRPSVHLVCCTFGAPLSRVLPSADP